MNTKSNIFVAIIAVTLVAAHIFLSLDRAACPFHPRHSRKLR
ncbi:MAG: hypothetical protein ABSE07_01610 [Methanoregula sp.]